MVVVVAADDDGSENAVVDGHNLLFPKSDKHLLDCHLHFHGPFQSSTTDDDDSQLHREPHVEQDVVPAWKQMFHHQQQQQQDLIPTLGSITLRVVFHVAVVDVVVDTFVAARA